MMWLINPHEARRHTVLLRYGMAWCSIAYVGVSVCIVLGQYALM